MTVLTKQLSRFTEAAIDDEVVIMRVETGDFFSLAGTAATIWQMMDDTSDRAALLQKLAAEFAVDESEIRSDLDDFVRQLSELGLIAVH